MIPQGTPHEERVPLWGYWGYLGYPSGYVEAHVVRRCPPLRSIGLEDAVPRDERDQVDQSPDHGQDHILFDRGLLHERGLQEGVREEPGK